jgi:hypothetical protein
MALLPDDDATRAAFARPRCSVSDGIGLDARRATTSFPDLPSARQRAAIADAWQRWASIVPLVFREVTSTPDIEIRFARGEHGDTPDGGGSVRWRRQRARARVRPVPPDSHGIAGDVHFDDDETWQEGFSATGGIDLLTVAVRAGVRVL